MATAACFIFGTIAPAAALKVLLEEESLSLESVDLVCCKQEPATQGQKAETRYKVILAASSSPHSQDALSRVAHAVVPGGRIYVYEAISQTDFTDSKGSYETARVDVLKKDLLLSGFTDSKALDATGLTSSVVAPPAVWVTAQLPTWGLGATAKLSLKRPAVAVAKVAEPTAATSRAGNGHGGGVWKLPAAGDISDEDEELLDEELLLSAEDRKAAPKPDDCEVGQSGRKACKNCSCGRAEVEAEAERGAGAVKLTADMLDNPQSACGNCYLGDAFRCGSCPYRGLPAFQAGEKVTLGAGLLTADV